MPVTWSGRRWQAKPAPDQRTRAAGISESSTAIACRRRSMTARDRRPTCVVSRAPAAPQTSEHFTVAACRWCRSRYPRLGARADASARRARPRPNGDPPRGRAINGWLGGQPVMCDESTGSTATRPCRTNELGARISRIRARRPSPAWRRAAPSTTTTCAPRSSMRRPRRTAAPAGHETPGRPLASRRSVARRSTDSHTGPHPHGVEEPRPSARTAPGDPEAKTR